SKKCERPAVTLQKSLRGLTRKNLHVNRVAVGQTHHEKRHLAQSPAYAHQSVTKVHLSLPRMMDQWHKHLAAPACQLAHHVLHHRVTARVATLVTQTVKDTLGRVALLAGQFLVRSQHPFNPAHKRVDLALLSHATLRVAWRR